MNPKIFISLLFIAIVTVSACKKEQAIQPDVLSAEYKLPQGNHPYDARIVDFYKKYGTYILYKFSSKDFRWNITGNILYAADQGDEAYIAQALDVLDTKLFGYYNDDFIRKALPYKIILSARIRELSSLNETDTIPTPINAVSTFSHFAFGNASSRLGQLSPEEITEMKADLHRVFWDHALRTKKIELPPDFAGATDYLMVAEYNKNRYGVFNVPDNITPVDDILDYIAMIVTHSKAEMDSIVFTPSNDPKGRFLFKYNIIVNYYKVKYNIDLQAIGNLN